MSTESTPSTELSAEQTLQRFTERLEAMQDDGHTWLTIVAVLSLLQSSRDPNRSIG